MAASSRRARQRRWLGACLVLAVAGPIALLLLRYEVRTALTALDAQTAFVVTVAEPTPGADPAAASAAVVRGRLRRYGLPARVAVDGARVVVAHRAADAALVLALSTAPGERYVDLLVDGLPPGIVEGFIETMHLSPPGGSIRRSHEIATVEGRTVLLRRTQVAGPGAITSASWCRGARGRVAVEFELSVLANRSLVVDSLTDSSHPLAIVVDGVVWEVPGGAPGRSGVIEPGADRTDDEVDRLVAILGGDPLPATLAAEPLAPGR